MVVNCDRIFVGIDQQIRFSGDTRQRILTCLGHAMHEGWSCIVPTILQMQRGITLARGNLFDTTLYYGPAREYCASSPAWEILDDPVPRLVPFLACQQALLVCADSAPRLYPSIASAVLLALVRAHSNLNSSLPAMRENDEALV
jgi:hypothetical protein